MKKVIKEQLKDFKGLSMKDYEKLTPSVQLMLEDAVSSNHYGYGISPRTLYSDIVNSLVSERTDKVAEIFGVSISLCEMIQKENNDY